MPYQKFRHNFSDTLNPICSCTLEFETTSHFLLHCHNYNNIRITLMSDLHMIDPSITFLNDTNLVHLLLFGNSKYNINTNREILIASISYLKISLIFEEQLFWSISFTDLFFLFVFYVLHCITSSFGLLFCFLTLIIVICMVCFVRFVIVLFYIFSVLYF